MTEDTADALYLALKGARERLCRVQVGHGLTESQSRQLGVAVEMIDRVGTQLPQWSRHDRTDGETVAFEYGVRWPASGEYAEVVWPAESLRSAERAAPAGGVVQERQVWRGPWREVPR